ncbi:MAG: C40 family peptidase [Actinobacteria bacterium]|nr:C40 family peptidase [Actinomycetota bacterium]
MKAKRVRMLRLGVAAVFVLSAVLGSVSASTAAPSKAQVQAAKAKLQALDQKISLLVERYDQARNAYQQTLQELADVRKAKADADAQAQAALDELSQRAVAAYTGMGSQLDAILGASSFTEFSDRIEYMGAVAQSDEDLAAQAAAASAKAKWAAAELRTTLAKQQQQRDALQGQIDGIKKAAAEQAALYKKLNTGYQAALAAERLAEQQAQQALNGGGSGGSYGGFTPPPNASAAEVAIAAARSVIGTQYVWGAADPNVGFDCSGLTMWAWGHAGVSLPHSAADQYAVLPHVSRDQLASGDLVFFYTPISHVGLYIGNGEMIDASHSGPGGEVAVRTVYWSYFVGAARPG